MTLSHKKTQRNNRETLKKVLAVARKEEEADLLLQDVELLDLINGGSEVTNVAIVEDTIVGHGKSYTSAKRVISCKGLTAVPGFIDAHLHVESSMMHPFEFERMTLPLGTTSAVCDPHELVNVLGKEGSEWFLRSSELMKQNLFVQMSSCVPALAGFETNGSNFSLADKMSLKNHPSVLGLGEMMNYPGVLAGNDEILDKLEAFGDLTIDGHAPLLQGRVLDGYLASGISTCHETVSSKEAKEKLQKGMHLFIREGTVAKNLKTLAEVVTEFSSVNCHLCTDDRNPFDLAHEGHLDHLIRMLINECKIPLHIAYRIASYSTARCYGLKRLGLIAPGKRADIVLLSDAKKVTIQDVIVGGEVLSELDLISHSQRSFIESNPPIKNTISRSSIAPSDFAYQFTKGEYRLIEIIPTQITTKANLAKFNGDKFEGEDILKISVVERYGHQAQPSIALVKGMGIKEGAMASSVAHDSHNIIVIGCDDESMATAVKALIQSGGGFVIANKEKVLSKLDLPIGGLMSLKSAEEISAKIGELKKVYHSLGGTLDEPFLQMAFLALPVIPEIKITDKGIMDLNSFSIVPFKVS